MRNVRNVSVLVALALVAGSARVSAVPTFVRQTGMTCNQCHVSFGGPVPNFTFTGKKFRMNGYRMPAVGERIEAGSPGAISGRRLNIPVIPNLSFRYQSVLAAQSKDPGALQKSPISTNPTSRFAFFPGGAITENLGVWLEFYFTPDGSTTSEWTQALASWDEYDLRLTKITDNSTVGLALSNQSLREVSGFGPWGTVGSQISKGLYNGWSHPMRANVFAYAWINDQILTVIGSSPGDNNLQWDKRNYQGQIAFAALHSDAAELWFNVMTQFGNDAIPLITSNTPNGSTRSWNYNDAVQGISATRATAGATTLRTSGEAAAAGSYLNTDIGDFSRIDPEVRLGFIDRGPHSMEMAIRFPLNHETYSDNAKATQNTYGTAIRYMYNRTVGFDINWQNDWKYQFTDHNGRVYDIKHNPVWNVYLKFQPAMNFLTTISFANSQKYSLTQTSVPTGWSWNFGVDYLF